MRRLLPLALIALIAAAQPGSDISASFSEYDPLSSNAVLAERLVPPLAGELAQRELASRGQMLADQPLNLAAEEFRLFVPAQQPAGGYGLMVFVPPWPEATVPPQWKSALAKRGMIMATMARAGNAEPVLGRREPLAILAAVNVMKRYRINPARVYVGGFSGGSKVAQRLALGYPDLFRGALLLAGADPLGEPGLAPPSLALFSLFRSAASVVLVTGAQDAVNIEQVRNAAAAMRRFCVQPAGMLVVPGMGHALINESWFTAALDRLDRPSRFERGADAPCLTKLRAGIDRDLDRIEVLIARGQNDTARRKLLEIDARFGGLAMPRSRELLHRIDAG